MRSHVFGILTVVLSVACDASVFETTSKRDAATSASPDAGPTSDAGPGPGPGPAPKQAGRGGSAAKAGSGGGSAIGTGSLPSTAAGSGGSAGESSVAAAGSGGAVAQARAGAGGETSKPEPDTCQNSCSAAHAKGKCKAGECEFSCDKDYGDCNANSDDGCEVSVLDAAEHCGACGNVCAAAAGTLAQCREAKCEQLSLIDEPGQKLAPHGTPIDSVTSQLCPAGSALTGIEGFVVDNMIADSLRIICSPLTLSGSAQAPAISVGKASVPIAEYAGGINREGNSQNPVPVPYKLSCGVGEVVKQLRVSVWAHWGDSNGHTYDTVKDLALACAKPVIEAGVVGFGPLGELHTTSATLQLEAAPVRDQTDTCGPSEAFLGFSLGFGANIDHISSTCEALRLSTEAQASR